MIARLRGELASHGQDFAVIDVHGVGYGVHMPRRDLERLSDGDEVTVHVYTYVREDQLSLFGFVEPLARAVFVKLININGVGPKLALSILSTFALSELRDVAFSGNVNALKRIPGVGPKTAQRLALELEGMLGDVVFAATAPLSASTAPVAAKPGPAAPPDAASLLRDVRSALVNLGYAEAQADDALGTLRREGVDPTTDINALLRKALALLRGR